MLRFDVLEGMWHSLISPLGHRGVLEHMAQEWLVSDVDGQILSCAEAFCAALASEQVEADLQYPPCTQGPPWLVWSWYLSSSQRWGLVGGMAGVHSPVAILSIPGARGKQRVSWNSLEAGRDPNLLLPHRLEWSKGKSGPQGRW